MTPRTGLLSGFFAVLLSIAAGSISGCREERCTGCGEDDDPKDAGRRLDSGSPPGGDGGVDRDTGARSDAGPLDRGPIDSGRPTGEPYVVLGTPGRILLLGTAVLPMDGSAPFVPGEVLIEGERIVCVGGAGACAAMASGASEVHTEGLILPGLVDAHNHVAYNWLPEWVPGRLFADHQAWQSSADYDAFVLPYDNNKTVRESLCAMVQWGEVRALVNGTTTIYGAGAARTCYRWLVRNPELGMGYSGLPDRIRSNVLGIDTVSDVDAAALIAAMNAGDVGAYMIHLSEGVSARAHAEYDELLRLMLLRPETVIIHGTALNAADFAQVAAAGAKLVWSPSSNLALYGDTTDVEAAKNAGISISLAPDWTPSGADDQLGELRFARELVATRWPGLFSDRELMEMVTSIPASQMAIGADVGQLAAGRLADILVLGIDPGADPYASAVQARPEEVRLVLLGGIPSFGDTVLLATMSESPEGCYPVDACGTQRLVCWDQPPAQTPPVPEVTVDSIAARITSFHPPGPLGLFDCN